MGNKNNLFFSKAFELVENKGILETGYVMYLSDMMLKKYPDSNINDVYDMICNYFPYKQLKKNQFAEEFEIRYGKSITLTSTYSLNIDDSKSFMKMMSLTMQENDENILNQIDFVDDGKMDFTFLSKYFSLHYQYHKFDILYYGYKYLCFKEEFALMQSEIKNTVKRISEENYYVQCDELFDSEVILQLLSKYNIKTLENLKNCDYTLLAHLFCLDFSRILKRIRLYTNIDQYTFS